MARLSDSSLKCCFACGWSCDYLQVVLQVVDQEGHVVAQPPLDGVRLCGLKVLPLHLQGPAVLQLRLHSPHAQQVPEHHIVPETQTDRHTQSQSP